MAWDHEFSLINSSIAALHMSVREFISCFVSTVFSSTKQSCTHHAGPDTTPCTARTSTQQRGRRPHRLLDQWIASAAAQFHIYSATHRLRSRPNQKPPRCRCPSSATPSGQDQAHRPRRCGSGADGMGAWASKRHPGRFPIYLYTNT